MHLFDPGWNQLRDTIFAKQKRLGVIPPDAKLTPWPDDLLKRWDQLSDDEKKLFIRQADVFAAYWAYSDNEIGRRGIGSRSENHAALISGSMNCSPFSWATSRMQRSGGGAQLSYHTA